MKLICHFCKREIDERHMERHQRSRICRDLSNARSRFRELVVDVPRDADTLAEYYAKRLRRYHSNTITKQDITR